MKEKILVVYSEGNNGATTLEWMERQSDREIVAVNFSEDDSFLLSNTAMIVGAKKVYMIDLLSASEPTQSTEEFIANKIIKIAEKEKANAIVASDDTCKLLLKRNPSIEVKSLIS